MTAATATTIRIIVGQAPPRELSPNASRELHWGTKARARKEFAASAWAACYDVAGLEPTITGPVRVTVRICWPRGRKRMDADNATAALKAMFDAFTRGGLWLDDRQVKELDVQQERLDKAGNANYPAGCCVVEVEVLP